MYHTESKVIYIIYFLYFFVSGFLHLLFTYPVNLRLFRLNYVNGFKIGFQKTSLDIAFHKKNVSFDLISNSNIWFFSDFIVFLKSKLIYLKVVYFLIGRY